MKKREAESAGLGAGDSERRSVKFVIQFADTGNIMSVFLFKSNMRYLLFLLLWFLPFVLFSAEDGTALNESAGAVASAGVSAEEASAKTMAGFPDVYKQESVQNIRISEVSVPASAVTEEESRSPVLNPASILLNNDILAYYGHPLSKNMGILGRYSKEALTEKLDALAKEYKDLSGGKDIKKAFYIIYATCWPGGETGIISDKVLKEYIDYAAENDMLVFLDHQIGKHDPVASLKKMLPYLKYPNVHLALDPEWRTTKPMAEIGSVTAGEINTAQKVMDDYIRENGITGERLLVIHQFNYVMIKNRKNVKADFVNVRLVLCMDGHGTPEKKRGTYAFNAEATNIPVKAFKLFYNEKGNTGVDTPLLTPKEVYELKPRPMLIMYQ